MPYTNCCPHGVHVDGQGARARAQRTLNAICSTLRGLRQQKVVRRAAELAGGDFTLADLEDCTVLLLGRLPALRILRAKRCCIVAGPVDGAAYLEGMHIWLAPEHAHDMDRHAQYRHSFGPHVQRLCTSSCLTTATASLSAMR